jgi:hypothetical protein
MTTARRPCYQLSLNSIFNIYYSGPGARATCSLQVAQEKYVCHLIATQKFGNRFSEPPKGKPTPLTPLNHRRRIPANEPRRLSLSLPFPPFLSSCLCIPLSGDEDQPS